MSKDQHQVSIPVPRSARLAVALLFFLNGAVFATWVTRIPAIQSKLLLTPGQLGLALLGIAAGALVAMNLSGFLSTRFGSRSVTTIAALCLCAILPLLALVPTLPALVATLLLFGASSGSMDVAMNTQGVAVERRYGRPILNSFHACYSLGGLSGALASGLIASLGLAPLPQFLGVALLFVLLTLAVTRLLLPAEARGAGEGESRLPFPHGQCLPWAWWLSAWYWVKGPWLTGVPSISPAPSTAERDWRRQAMLPFPS